MRFARKPGALGILSLFSDVHEESAVLNGSRIRRYAPSLFELDFKRKRNVFSLTNIECGRKFALPPDRHTILTSIRHGASRRGGIMVPLSALDNRSVDKRGKCKEVTEIPCLLAIQICSVESAEKVVVLAMCKNAIAI